MRKRLVLTFPPEIRDRLEALRVKLGERSMAAVVLRLILGAERQ